MMPLCIMGNSPRSLENLWLCLKGIVTLYCRLLGNPTQKWRGSWSARIRTPSYGTGHKCFGSGYLTELSKLNAIQISVILTIQYNICRIFILLSERFQILPYWISFCTVFYRTNFDSVQCNAARSPTQSNVLQHRVQFRAMFYITESDSEQCFTARSLTQSNVLQHWVWLRAMFYSTEFDSEQCFTARSLTQSNVMQHRVWLRAVFYRTNFDSAQCNAARSLTQSNVLQHGVRLRVVQLFVIVALGGFNSLKIRKILWNCLSKNIFSTFLPGIH